MRTKSFELNRSFNCDRGRPIRVLQFITASGFYGAERWVLALANNLDGTSVRSELAVSEEGGAQDL